MPTTATWIIIGISAVVCLAVTGYMLWMTYVEKDIDRDA